MNARKPRDFGDGATASSYLAAGAWLAVTRPAPGHGMVELTGAPVFPETSRGVQGEVRAYRASLTRAETAFLTPSAPAELEVTASGSDDGVLWLRCEPVRELTAGELWEVGVRFNGRLQRPPYAEITDIAPLPPLPDDSCWEEQGGNLLVRSATLDARANISIELSGHGGGQWTVDEFGAMWIGRTTVDHGRRPALILRCELRTGITPGHGRGATAEGADLMRPINASLLPADPDLAAKMERIIAGTRQYILQCCALDTSPSESVIVTDHRLLPLSWTRDAYYMALLLLLCGDEASLNTVERHLRWLWGPSHSAGPWMRSHLATGEVKDPGLQADQQLFPILELVDFRRATGEWPTMTDEETWGRRIESALSALPVQQSTGLLMSDENPADDASGLPLLFSSQVLFAHVLDGLAEFAEELDLHSSELHELAESVRSATRSVFTVDDPAGSLFAYEADGNGQTRLYGDANDIPTALAAAWGFCSADDAVWQRTMDFILSPRNSGWSAGDFGGLGSAHTPGTWPLGDVQTLILRQTLGDVAECNAIIARIATIASDDGLLPETYDSQTGTWRARHWFGWPSAAAAVALLSREWSPAPPAPHQIAEEPIAVEILNLR